MTLFKGYICCVKIVLLLLICSTCCHCADTLPPHVVNGRQDSGEKVSSHATSTNQACLGEDALVESCMVDPYGFEAIRSLHHQLDDDRNGNVDISETNEFLRDELQYQNGNERQIKAFHGNDKYISVDEMWHQWRLSEVHNWTVEETVAWLVTHVDLPQYAKLFQDHGVNGTRLPLMAVNNQHFLTNELGIKDVIHKQKLVLKAMDVVLFGAPKSYNLIKDMILCLSLIIALLFCWFAYAQNKKSQRQLRKMTRDMDSLQKAEEALLDLQRELDRAKAEQESAALLKQQLEEERNAAKEREHLLTQMSTDPENNRNIIMRLQEENTMLKEELTRTQMALSSRAWTSPPQLQHWLQLTHELEVRHYNIKKAAAENQLAAAKEACEKLRRKRGNFMGPFRIAHGGSIDDIDDKILRAKAALSEVTRDLQERLHRWKQIERLCNCSIVTNKGIVVLEQMLHGYQGYYGTTSAGSTKGVISRSGSEGTLTEDESPPSYVTQSMPTVQQLIRGSTPLFVGPSLHHYPIPEVPLEMVSGYGSSSGLGYFSATTGNVTTISRRLSQKKQAPPGDNNNVISLKNGQSLGEKPLVASSARNPSNIGNPRVNPSNNNYPNLRRKSSASNIVGSACCDATKMGGNNVVDDGDVDRTTPGSGVDNIKSQGGSFYALSANNAVASQPNLMSALLTQHVQQLVTSKTSTNMAAAATGSVTPVIPFVPPVCAVPLTGYNHAPMMTAEAFGSSAIHAAQMSNSPSSNRLVSYGDPDAVVPSSAVVANSHDIMAPQQQPAPFVGNGGGGDDDVISAGSGGATMSLPVTFTLGETSQASESPSSVLRGGRPPQLIKSYSQDHQTMSAKLEPSKMISSSSPALEISGTPDSTMRRKKKSGMFQAIRNSFVSSGGASGSVSISGSGSVFPVDEEASNNSSSPDSLAELTSGDGEKKKKRSLLSNLRKKSKVS